MPTTIHNRFEHDDDDYIMTVPHPNQKDAHIVFFLLMMMILHNQFSHCEYSTCKMVIGFADASFGYFPSILNFVHHSKLQIFNVYDTVRFPLSIGQNEGTKTLP